MRVITYKNASIYTGFTQDLTRHIERECMPTSVLKYEPHIDFNNGSPSLSIYLSDVSPLEDEVWEFIENLSDENISEEIVLDIQCDLSSLLNSVIDGRRYTAHNEITVSKDDEPLFKSIRSELLKLIEKIDAIKYTAA